MAAAARTAGRPQFLLEKDYALSYLLAGVAAVPALRESLVFKGGTCLRKAYFPGIAFLRTWTSHRAHHGPARHC